MITRVTEYVETAVTLSFTCTGTLDMFNAETSPVRQDTRRDSLSQTHPSRALFGGMGQRAVVGRGNTRWTIIINESISLPMQELTAHKGPLQRRLEVVVVHRV